MVDKIGHWEYKQSGSTKNSRGMAKQHYPTMSTDDICKLPLKDIKTDDAICLMWATFPTISEVFKKQMVGTFGAMNLNMTLK
jgi:N6-adenosine-specific RNA methylase IME4